MYSDHVMFCFYLSMANRYANPADDKLKATLSETLRIHRGLLTEEDKETLVELISVECNR